MLEISKNGIIAVSRGDCFEIPATVNKGNDTEIYEYDLQEGDYLNFYVREVMDYCAKDLICKTILCTTNEDGEIIYSDDRDGYFNPYTSELTFRFNSEDTEKLLPGTYYYQIKLFKKLSDEEAEKFAQTHDVNTIVTNRLFYVLD